MKFMHYIRPIHSLAGLALALSSLSFAVPAKAMSVQPMVSDMTPSGSKTSSQITVVNDANIPLPVEIVIYRMNLDEAGEMEKIPGGDEFLVLPQQALIPPGAAQSFRVQWVGQPQIQTSQSYVFSVNQVPVKMKTGDNNMQIVFNFATIINMTPATGKSEINLVKSGIGKDDKGVARPEVTVRNPGNIHAKLTDATIKLSGGSWSQTLTPDQLRQTVGVGLVQPGKTRRFLLPVDLPAGVSQVTASIDYKPAK